MLLNGSPADGCLQEPEYRRSHVPKQVQRAPFRCQPDAAYIALLVFCGERKVRLFCTGSMPLKPY